MNRHTIFDDEGNEVRTTIKSHQLNLVCLHQGKIRIFIAYLRHSDSGHTLYGASILKSTTKGNVSKDIRRRHWQTSKDRLFQYPVFMKTTPGNSYASYRRAEWEIRKMIAQNGVCLRRMSKLDQQRWVANPEYQQIWEWAFDPSQYQSCPRQSVSNHWKPTVKWDRFMWYYEKNRAIVCAYRTDRVIRKVSYGASIFRYDYPDQYGQDRRIPKSMRAMYSSIAYHRLQKCPVMVTFASSPPQTLCDLKKSLRLHFRQDGVKGQRIKSEPLAEYDGSDGNNTSGNGGSSGDGDQWSSRLRQRQPIRYSR